MVYELLDGMILGKVYHLQELYALVEEYCLENAIEDWKHKVRALLEEREGERKLGPYTVTYYGGAYYSIG